MQKSYNHIGPFTLPIYVVIFICTISTYAENPIRQCYNFPSVVSSTLKSLREKTILFIQIFTMYIVLSVMVFMVFCLSVIVHLGLDPKLWCQILFFTCPHPPYRTQFISKLALCAKYTLYVSLSHSCLKQVFCSCKNLKKNLMKTKILSPSILIKSNLKKKQNSFFKVMQRREEKCYFWNLLTSQV